MSVSGPFPIGTTVANGMFADASADGFVQGHVEPDPAKIFALSGSLLSTNETLPMWGGLPIFLDIPGGAGNPVEALGPSCGRATTVSGGSKPIQAWSTFDQAYGMVQTPSSTVQLAYSGMQVNYYPSGSGALMAVQADPSLLALQGGLISQSVAWDFVNGLLVPYTGAVTISSGTYNSTTGEIVLTLASTPSPFPGVGDSVTLSSLTGSGAYASLDGTWDVLAGSSGTTLNLQATSGLGSAAITGGSATTGSALGLNVMAIQAGNSQVVAWESPNANWNFGGCCALIQI